jgi:hypothetical protein
MESISCVLLIKLLFCNNLIDDMIINLLALFSRSILDHLSFSNNSDEVGSRYNLI